TIFTATAPIDTVVVDGGLLPKQTYTYQLMQEFNGNFVPADAPLVVTTLDTTSHNFTWQMDTLGDGNASALYDVAIINDTLIVACGDINIIDSLGYWEAPYGVAIWNGRSWRLQRLLAPNPNGYNSILRPYGIFAFTPHEIWFADAGVFKWSGTGEFVTPYWIDSFQGNPNPLLAPGQGVEKLWGTSSRDLYAVGSQGATAHFDGNVWQKLESGTTYDIQDIYGTKDSRSGKYRILAVASNIYTGQGPKVLEIDGENVALLPDNGLPWSLDGLWSSSLYRNYIVGDGMFFKSSLNATTPWRGFHSGLTTYYTNAIRGTASNDIMVVGAYGVALHYNGSSWKNYQAETYIDGSLFRVEAQGSFVVAVGQVGNRAVVLRGYR
ncbi:MAG: hypothetical protein HYR76_06700, partial [Ignavibacteria bacterium]|nr:hypothetical protein [Ignavibacteria bacterium]